MCESQSALPELRGLVREKEITRCTESDKESIQESNVLVVVIAHAIVFNFIVKPRRLSGDELLAVPFLLCRRLLATLISREVQVLSYLATIRIEMFFDYCTWYVVRGQNQIRRECEMPQRSPHIFSPKYTLPVRHPAWLPAAPRPRQLYSILSSSCRLLQYS